MSREPRGLGKGLGALLGEAAPAVEDLRVPVGYVNKEIAGGKTRYDNQDIMRIPVDMIEANPFQPRKTFDQGALEELAASIKSLGLIQPVTVRRISQDKFQIISGERRFRASRLAGLEMIPAYIREANDQGMLEMAIVENLQRENLDPIETAMSFQRLIDECSLTQEQMADRLGTKRSSVANTLRLLKLPAKVQHDLKVGLLSVGHAKVLLGIENAEDQEKLCDIVIADGLSVRALEELVRKLLAGERVPAHKSAGKPSTEIPDSYSAVAGRLGRFFTGGVSMKKGADGKGSMTLKFASDAEAENFLKALEDAGI